MDNFVIEGKHTLTGEIPISGSKNAALPALAATVLTEDTVILERIPEVRDVWTMMRLLKHIGVCIEQSDNAYSFKSELISLPEAPYNLVKTMRASSLVLGPLIARTGRARVSMPGGCAIGARPIDLHMNALEQLGARITQDHGYVEAQAPDGLHGSNIRFERVTVTGTEDIMMAAVLARGETVLENAALEPEVVDLANLLKKMGALIEGEGTPTIKIQGVDRLRSAHHAIIADRIEAGTFLIAGLAVGHGLTVTGVHAAHLEAVTEKMSQAGAEISYPREDAIYVEPKEPLRAVDISTQEYPGFPTDMQAQFTALNSVADGTGSITETVFENRFMHVHEMNMMGASIRVEGNTVIVDGVDNLKGAPVMATDLRASASLIIAGLVSDSETSVDRIYHIDRGYECIEEKLQLLGARIRRVPS